MQFHIERMACCGCAKTVTNAIHAIDQSAKVTTDLAAKAVTVETTASRDDVTRALDAAGYPSTANLGSRS